MTATPKPLRLALVALAFALTGCGKWADELFCGAGGCGFSDSEWARVTSLANPDDPPPDLSNEFRDGPFVAALGKKFYFDPAFSGNATQLDAIRRESPAARAPKGQPIGIACVTCHDLEHGGADTSSSPGHVSVGAGWTDVNALSVLNSVYRQVVFWNGRADSLWALNAIVAESPTTMNGNRLKTAHVIASRYPGEYLQAFGSGSLDLAAIAALPENGKPGNNRCDDDPVVIATEPFNDAYDCLDVSQRDMVTRILVNWSKAIAAYEYKLISRNSPFDKFVTEGRDSTRLSAAAKRGARLFVGKGACVDCHAGPQLTDELFHDIGVPQTGTAVPRTTDCPKGNTACDCSDQTTNLCLPWGAWDGMRRLQGTKLNNPSRPNAWLRTGKWSGNPGDTSRGTYVGLPDTADFDRLKGAWRTPSLRNVAQTAPYMHDGYYASLKDVIWHYNNGAATAGPEQVGVTAPQIKPLLLTESEQDDLIAFLETLTGEPLPDDLRLPPPLPPVGGWPTPTGTGGSGGGGGGPPPLPGCVGERFPSPLITDFADASADSPLRFGAAPNLTGAAFSYVAPGLRAPVLSVAQGRNGTPALKIAVDTGPPTSASDMWFGFGLTFDSCVDLRPYDAVQFTFAGDVANCPIRFAVMSSQTVSSKDDPRGTCTQASCYPPSVPFLATGTVVVPLSNLSFGGFPGSPNVVDPSSVVGIQWQMDAPGGGCTASYLIDDITLVNTGALTGSGGSGPPPSGAGGMGGGTGGRAGSPTGGGGSSAPPLPVSCAPTPPSSSLVTDFNSSLDGSPIVFMSPSGIAGRTFSYGPAGVPPPWPIIRPGPNGTPALLFATRAAPPPVTGWYGFGLTFDNCVDARAFDRVRFTIGSPAATTCPVEFAVTARENLSFAEDPRGTCPAIGACPPAFLAVPQLGTVTAPFPPTGGAFEPGALIGVQWRVPASCSATFAVDDIVFAGP